MIGGCALTVQCVAMTVNLYITAVNYRLLQSYGTAYYGLWNCAMIWGCFAVRERSMGKGTFLLETG